MVRQIKMPIESGEFEALMEADEDDLLSVGNQARHWVRTALQERGLLDGQKDVDAEDEAED